MQVPVHCAIGPTEAALRKSISCARRGGLGGATLAVARKQHAMISFPQKIVQMQHGGGLQNDDGTDSYRRSLPRHWITRCVRRQLLFPACCLAMSRISIVCRSSPVLDIDPCPALNVK